VRRAAAVHYTTEAEQVATETFLGLNHGKVITLGIEANSAAPRSPEKLSRYFPDLADEPYVLVLSRLHPKKGLDVLIDAFNSLVQQKKFAHWRLVIAGDGPAEYVSKLRAKVVSGSHPERVLFTGWLEGEKKAVVLSNACLLVLPSHQENFGLCVMEALSNAVPVLISPHVNLASEIANANAGWISEVEKQALADRLAEALGDESERTTRGLAGKELSRKYSWASSAKNLIELYKEILTQRREDAE
jgi:glycosyltransferase involved in cell wall biosynthesis